MKVENLMSTDVRICGPDETLQVAARLMWEFDVGSLPVVDGAGRLVGIVTDRDVCMASFQHDERLSELRVAEAMTADVFTVFPSDSLETAERAMRDGQVRRVPVVDAKGQLRGILSLNDIVRATLRLRNAGISGLSDGAVVDTLAAICEPQAPSKSAGSSGEHAVNLSG
jgi:CBS domain-containing protein